MCNSLSLVSARKERCYCRYSEQGTSLQYRLHKMALPIHRAVHLRLKLPDLVFIYLGYQGHYHLSEHKNK